VISQPTTFVCVAGILLFLQIPASAPSTLPTDALVCAHNLQKQTPLEVLQVTAQLVNRTSVESQFMLQVNMTLCFN